LLLVSTVAPPIVVVFRLPAVAAAGLLVLVLVLVPPLPLLDVPDELHAASGQQVFRACWPRRLPL
jgi:hypothetical protein